MSAPTTNIEKQKSRHSGVLRGIAVATGFVAILFAVFYFMVTNDDPTDDGIATPAAVEEAS